MLTAAMRLRTCKVVTYRGKNIKIRVLSPLWKIGGGTCSGAQVINDNSPLAQKSTLKPSKIVLQIACSILSRQDKLSARQAFSRGEGDNREDIESLPNSERAKHDLRISAPILAISARNLVHFFLITPTIKKDVLWRA